MSNQYDHLELPKISIQLPKRSRSGFGSGEKRDNRQSHGIKLLKQASLLVNRPPKEVTPFGIDPKLIFKIKLRKKDNVEEKNIY